MKTTHSTEPDERFPSLPETIREKLCFLLRRLNTDLEFFEIDTLLKEMNGLLGEFGGELNPANSSAPDASIIIEEALKHTKRSPGRRVFPESHEGNPLGKERANPQYQPVAPFLYQHPDPKINRCRRYLVWLYLEKCISKTGISDFRRQKLGEQLQLAAGSRRSINRREEMLQELAERTAGTNFRRGKFEQVVREWSRDRKFGHGVQGDFRRELLNLFGTKSKERRTPGPSGVDKLNGENWPGPPELGSEYDEDDDDPLIDGAIDLVGATQSNDEGLPSSYWLTDCLQATPATYRRWNDSERAIFFQCWQRDYVAGTDAEKGQLTIMLLVLLTAQSLEEWETRCVGEPGSIDIDGNYHRDVRPPHGALKLGGKFAAALQERAETIRLPLPRILTEALHQCGLAEMHGRPVLDLAGGDLEKLAELLKIRLKTWREETGLQFWYSRLEAQFPIELSIHYQNSLYVYLLSASENKRWPMSMYYQSVRVTDLIQSWQSVQQQLICSLSAADPDLLKVGTDTDTRVGVRLNEQSEKEIVASLTRRAQTIIRGKSTLAYLHNQYVLYVVSLLFWSTGHRPVRDPFWSPGEFDEALGLAIVDDKSVFSQCLYRLLPLCKTARQQIRLYQRHLRGLAAKLQRKGKKYRELAIAIYRLAEGDTTTGVPWLFLLDENCRVTRSISAAAIRELWGEALPGMPPNYGRYFLFSELTDRKVPYDWIEALMGHGIRSEHVFGDSSEYVPAEVMETLAREIEASVQNVGWSPMEGIRPHGTDIIKKWAASDASTGTLHEETLLGPQYRAAQRRRENKKINEQIKTLVTGILKERYEGEVPPIRQWQKEDFNALLKAVSDAEVSNGVIRRRALIYIRRLVGRGARYRLPVGKVKALMPSFSVSTPIHSQLMKQYRVVVYAREAFTNYLNLQGDYHHIARPSTELRLAEIVVSAAVFGGLFNERYLRLLPFAVHREISRFGTDIHVLIRERPCESEDSEGRILFRWLPDPISQALYLGYVQLERSGEPKWDVVEEQLQLVARQVGWKPGRCDDVFSWLSRQGECFMRLNAPGYVSSGQLPHALQAVSSAGSWSQITTGNRCLAYRMESSVTDAPPEIIGQSGTNAGEFMKAMRNAFHTVDDVAAKGKARTDKKQLEVLSAALEEKRSASNEWPLVAQVLCAWLLNMARHGTPRRRYPAVSTLRRYFYMIARPLLSVADREHDFLNFDSDGFEDVYHAACQASTERYIGKVWGQLSQFHGYMMKANRVAPVTLPRGDYGDAQDPLPDANWLSEHEYLEAQQWIEGDPRLDEQQKLILGILLLLLFRFGLRISEAVHIPYEALQIHQQQKNVWLRIRNTAYRQLKHRRHSVRQIPCVEELTDHEWWLLEQIHSAGELRYSQDRQTRLLGDFTRATLSGNQVRTYLYTLMRAVTGEPQLHGHHLRHGFANRIFASLNQEPITRSGETTKDTLADIKRPRDGRLSLIAGKERGRRRLKALRDVLGHSDESITLQWYLHQIDEVTQRAVNTTASDLGDVGWSYASGIKYTTIKKRRRAKSGVSNTELFEKEMTRCVTLGHPTHTPEPLTASSFYAQSWKAERYGSVRDVFNVLAEIDFRKGSIDSAIRACVASEDFIKQVAEVAMNFQRICNHSVFRIDPPSESRIVVNDGGRSSRRYLNRHRIKRLERWFAEMEERLDEFSERDKRILTQFIDIWAGSYYSGLGALCINDWLKWERLISAFRFLDISVRDMEIMLTPEADSEDTRARIRSCGIRSQQIRLVQTRRERQALKAAAAHIGILLRGADKKVRLHTDLPYISTVFSAWLRREHILTN